MKLVEPSEETYALWINKEDFTLFDLFYTNLGYKTIGGQEIGQFISHCGYFIVDKADKTIEFMETLSFSVYEGKEYAIKDVIKSDESETISGAEKLTHCPFCGDEIVKSFRFGGQEECVIKIQKN